MTSPVNIFALVVDDESWPRSISEQSVVLKGFPQITALTLNGIWASHNVFLAMLKTGTVIKSSLLLSAHLEQVLKNDIVRFSQTVYEELQTQF